MKRAIFSCMTALSLSIAMSVPVLAAQEQQQRPTYYFLVNLGTPLGGTASLGSSVNDRGWVAGGATTADSTEHAVLWLGSALDLGTLGGPNSNVAWPNPNNRGELAGIAETAKQDPNKENWSCSGFFPATTHNICLGFVWQWGEMTALPTLGGNNGYAAGINNWGQVVGWAENTTHDPTCALPQVLQFEAVIWGPEPGQLKQLTPFHGDPDSAATAVNDSGQVVGISGICDNAIGEFSARHALLWENGKPIDLGNFGGVAWNTPTAINNRGQIVGFADLPGDQDGGLNPIAFLWTKEHGIQKLLPYPGDANSLAWGINERGQAVGQSIDASGNSRAVIWQDGEPIDLNALIPPDSPLYLTLANDINDRGEIAGQACVASGGVCGAETPAILLIPTHVVVGGDAVSAPSATSSRTVVLSDTVRKQVLQRVGVSHFGGNR
jgi:probable HAF family extracellular repeat protein